MLRRYVPAVLDQLAAAATSFLVVVLVARAVDAEEFGVFSLIYACIVLVLLVHHAFFCEAYIVFFSRDQQREARVFSYVYGRHAAVVLYALALLTCFLPVRHLGGLAEAVVRYSALFFALAALATLQLCRRASYTRHTVGPAAAGSVVHLVVAVLITYFAVAAWNGREIESAFAALGLGGAAGALTIRFLRRRDTVRTIGAESDLQESAYWRYGWNAAVAALLGWVPANVYYFALSAAQGLGEAGVFRAVHTLTTPITHFNAALGLALVPTLVGQASERGLRLKATQRLALAFFAGAAVIALAFVPFAGDVITLIYGPAFEVGAKALAIVLMGAPFTAATTVLIASLRAERSADRVLSGLCWSVAVSLAFGIPAAAYLGSVGAAMGYVLSQCVAVLAMWYHVKSNRLTSAS